MVIDSKFQGKQYPSVSYEIGKEKVLEFVRAIKADPNKFSEIVPPTFPVVYSSELLGAVLYDDELNLNLMKLVHGEQEFVYHKPVRVGDAIKSTGTIEKIFQKGPHDFLVFRIVSENQNGEQVAETIWTLLVRGGNDKDFSFQEKFMMKLAALMANLGALFGLGTSPHSSQDTNTMKPGFNLLNFHTDPDSTERMTVLVDKYMPQIYAGASGDFNAIHLDDHLGKSVGLGGYILHGMATMALGANFLLQNRDLGSLKKYKARFTAPVRPFDLLTYEGKFNPENRIFTFGAKNQKGASVLSVCTAEF